MSTGLHIAARVLLAAIFLISGVHKIVGFQAVAGAMAAKGLPMPEILLVLTIVLEIAASLLLIFGVQMQLAAAALALFTLAVGLIFHNFWAVEPAQYMNQFNHFMKNVAIIGGLLLVVAGRPRSPA